MNIATAQVINLSSICIGILLLLSCESQPPEQHPLPRLDEIRSEHRQPTQMPTSRQAGPRTYALIRQIELTLDQSLAEAWALVDEAAFPPHTRNLWHANGLRCGLIANQKLSELVTAIPGDKKITELQLTPSSHLIPILQSPHLAKPFDAITSIDQDPPATLHISRGRLQILARLLEPQFGQVIIDLVPHNYIPHTTLLPRNPLAKELDGILLEDLAVRLEISSDISIIIGLDRQLEESYEVESQTASSESHGETAATSEQSVPTNADIEARAITNESLPDHMGNYLFASMKYGKPVQVLLIISVDTFAGESE